MDTGHLDILEIIRQDGVELRRNGTYRRLKDRLGKMLKYEDSAPENLYLYTKPFPKMGAGGLSALKERVQLYPDCRLVIIDTLQMFRPPSNNKKSYEADYEAISELKQLADALHVSMLIVHHLRKMETEDRFDDISGTYGISGAADGLLLLIREAGEYLGELRISGRDMDSKGYAMKFNPDILTWNLMGDACELQTTAKKQKLFNTIKEYGRKQGISRKMIVEKSELSVDYVKRMLPYILQGGQVVRAGRGLYKWSDI